MGASPNQFPPSVTAHAVIRYVQRHLGVVVDIDEFALTRPFAMHLHLYAAGITLEQAEAAILTPAVVTAILSGVTQIKSPPVGRLVIKSNAVVTINPLRYDGPRKRGMREPSRKELKRQFRKEHVRKRKRVLA